MKQQRSGKTVFTPLQLQKLQSVFDQDSTPGTNVKRYLARDLGLEPKAVMVWFNNRATRGKRRGERLISRTVSNISELHYEPARLNVMAPTTAYNEMNEAQRSSSSNTPKATTKNEFHPYSKMNNKSQRNLGFENSFSIHKQPSNFNNNELASYHINNIFTQEYQELRREALRHLFGPSEADLRLPLSRSYQSLPDQDQSNLNFINQLFGNTH